MWAKLIAAAATVSTLGALCSDDTIASSTITPPSGLPVTVQTLSRHVGSAAGGAPVAIDGSGFSAGTIVTFGGVPATAIEVTSGTSMVATAPPGQPGTVTVTVSNGPGTEANAAEAFEYLPAATRTYISHDFEDGTVGAFDTYMRSGGTVQVSEWGTAVSGTRAVRTQIPSGVEGSARLVHFYQPSQPANEPGGVYQRWYIRVDQETLQRVRPGQIKLLLNRGDSNPPSWLHMGIGGQFPGADGQIKVLLDYNTGLLPNGGTETGAPTLPDRWIEIQTWYERKPGVGRARMWVDGQLVTDHSDPNFGTDSTAQVMRWFLGIGYTQATTPGGRLTVFVDDAVAADGYVEAVR